MANVLSYSGILTKVRAMESNLMTEEDYKAISNLETTSEFINYVKNNPNYTSIFKNVNEETLHRSEIEELLTQSIYSEFSKIYRFANIEQRKALDILSFRFEVDTLKICLQNVFSDDHSHSFLFVNDFFLRHTELNIKALSAAPTIEAFISLLVGTRYHSLFTKLYATHHTTLQDYEVQLDIYYFTKVWRMKDKVLTGDNQKAVKLIYGVQIDLLNILWIYRSKYFYDIEAGKILANLIPINHKLSKAQLTSMVEAVSIEEFMKVLESTFYSKAYGTIEVQELEAFYYQMLSKLFKVCTFKYPTSMAPILKYLYKKAVELDHLTTALECIRYHLDPSETLSYILH